MDLRDNKLTRYLVSAKEELKKVVWPTKKQTWNHTMLVIGISLGVAAFIGILDYVFTFGLENLLNKFKI